ncbi:ureidoglycolate hydrolase [Euphorbia peplus]|nr:ureidoglycolate hydrolase [Euphorbia peplus]
MEISSETELPPARIKLKVIEATPESFKEYGQVIESSADGEIFGPQDAQLNLSQGIPRFYIMHLENRPLEFSTITHHARVTQCLGSIGGHDWYLGVAKPSIVNSEGKKGGDDDDDDVVQSHCGHFYVAPALEEVRVFKFSGAKFVKLDRGTWHAGPLFEADSMDFYNLELSNTNEVDRTTHHFKKNNNVVFSIEE